MTISQEERRKYIRWFIQGYILGIFLLIILNQIYDTSKLLQDNTLYFDLAAFAFIWIIIRRMLKGKFNSVERL